MTGTCHQTK